MDYVLRPGQGRDDFVRFWALLADEVKGHPSAFAAELMNEPMSLERKWMFDAWRECAEAITQIVPDMSVSICDIGEGSVLPKYVTELTGGFEDISAETEQFIRESNLIVASD